MRPYDDDDEEGDAGSTSPGIEKDKENASKQYTRGGFQSSEEFWFWRKQRQWQRLEERAREEKLIKKRAREARYRAERRARREQRGNTN